MREEQCRSPKNQFNTHTHSHTNRDEALRQNVPLKINAFEREDFLFFSPFRRPPFNPPGDRTLAALTRGGAAHNSTTRTGDTPNNFNISLQLGVRKGHNTQTPIKKYNTTETFLAKRILLTLNMVRSGFIDGGWSRCGACRAQGIIHSDNMQI